MEVVIFWVAVLALAFGVSLLVGLPLTMAVDGILELAGFTNPILGWAVCGALIGWAWALVLVGRRYRAKKLSVWGTVGLVGITAVLAFGFASANSHRSGGTPSVRQIASLPGLHVTYVYVTADNVNVRLNADTSGRVVGSVSKGQRVEVIGNFFEWRNVRIQGSASPEGWIHSRYLSTTQP